MSTDAEQLTALLARTGDGAILGRVDALLALSWSAARLDAAAMEVDPISLPWVVRGGIEWASDAARNASKLDAMRERYHEAERRVGEARNATTDGDPWIWSDDDSAETVNGFGELMTVRITGGHLRALIESTGRTRAELVAMRDQSSAVCERRTRELEALRSQLDRQRTDAMLGAAVRELTEQLRRLRRNPCESMRFGFEPDSIAAAAISEVAEVQAEPIGSDAAKRETGGVLACALHLMLVHNAPLTWTIEAEARRLRRRLDFVEAGGTWEEAKAAEVAANAVPPDWLEVEGRVEDCDGEAGTVLLLRAGRALVDYGATDDGYPPGVGRLAWWPFDEIRAEGWRDDSSWETSSS